MNRLVIGILAHVDSGKTTLSEGLMYSSGGIKKIGRVDHGDAFLDSHGLERERGITIFSKQAVLRLGDMEITLLDTPGHVDFSPEMERTLQVLDYGILVISGNDGMQSHTETLWRLLRQHGIPTFLFVNKMDLAGADRESLMESLKRRLHEGCVDFGSDILAENLAMCDEGLLNQFLEIGSISTAAVASGVAAGKVFPCYFGSALKLQGVDEFLAGLEKYTENPSSSQTFGGRVFKISRDEQGNRLTYIKITGGSLKVKTQLMGFTREKIQWSEKVNQIRIYSGAKFITVEEAFPGMICAVAGLTKTYPGEGLGAEQDAESSALSPVLSYRVELPSSMDAHMALSKLRLLEEEEPQLQIAWNEQLQEIHLRLMGEVQMEVLKRLVWERFQMEINFGAGKVMYKETIGNTVEGVGHFEPLRHYAEVHLLLEPGELGSGLCFDTRCNEDDLDKNWQRLALGILEEKLHVGVLTGSPITDMKITLEAGRAHQKHTEGGDFRQAVLRGVRQGLRQAENILLEPWYDFRLEVPSEALGRAMSDVQRMNGSFAPPEILGEFGVLVGDAPLASMENYQAEITNYTGGRGRISCVFKGYAPCHNTEEVVSAIGYDADSDIENTGDSVFCSQGAGFIVKWDHVKEHMHIPSVLCQEVFENDNVDKLNAARMAAYRTTLAEDKELAEIFQRTYGPIRRDPRAVFDSIKKESKAPEKAPSGRRIVDEGPEYLLVDGYNIIFSWDDLSVLARGSLDAARNRLINILCNYQGFCQYEELILVFDAYKVKGNPGMVEKVHNITVVYTKEAETADMYIEKVTNELGKNRRARVATSDGMEQLIILSHGALRVPARVFQEEVKEVEKAIRSYLL